MKLIHCADLHLDSKMNTHLGSQKAKERKTELLHTFTRMIDYAKDENVKQILIAGDLFDTRKVSATASNMVLELIQKNDDISFYYLRGNHDQNSFIGGMEEIPANLKLFDEDWTYYRIGGDADKKICIAATEASLSDIDLVCRKLSLESEEVNIVLMHGQEAGSGSADGVIPLKELRNKNIDYLALGHVHFYKKAELDARGVYCYPGCLEGRGFDECGEHGFVLVDIDTESGKVQADFISFASRKLYEVEVDVKGCTTTLEVEDKVREVLEKKAIPHKHLLRVCLCGERDCESEWNLSFIEKQFEDDYYFFCMKDCSSLKVDYEAFANDVSLKGEFVRKVMQDETLSEEEKAMVVRCGICALKGEEF